MSQKQPPLDDRVRAVEMIILDVDGVLTDGSIVYGDDGREWKRFHVRDGAGLRLWQRAGLRVGLISGRSSPAVTARAAELGIEPILQGRSDKRAALREFLGRTGVEPWQCAAIGDDLPDLPILMNVGVSVAVADACPAVRDRVDRVTERHGGHGAVREMIEWLLTVQGRWDAIVQRYGDQTL